MQYIIIRAGAGNPPDLAGGKICGIVETEKFCGRGCGIKISQQLLENRFCKTSINCQISNISNFKLYIYI